MTSETEAVRVREEIKRDLDETRQERDRQREEAKQKDKLITEYKGQIDSQARQLKEAQEKRPQMLEKVVEGLKKTEEKP
jgi:hypothetical protein